MSSKILLTGRSGFVGHHLTLSLLQHNYDVISLDRSPQYGYILTNGLASTISVTSVQHDFRAFLPDRILKTCEGVDYIIHNGATVHGLRSLEDPELFVHTNVMGTFNMLEAARVLKPKKFLYVSSAEAVGSAPSTVKSWDEEVTLHPSNPYAAAKGAGELLCQSYMASFGVPCAIVRTMNIFGEYQDTSKFVPMVIKKILNDEEVICHTKDGVSGSRHWIYVKTLVDAMIQLLQSDKTGIYHIVGSELSNLEVIRLIERGLDQKANLIFKEPGKTHDMRYSIRDTKLNNYPEISNTELDLIKTAIAYKHNQEWLQ